MEKYYFVLMETDPIDNWFGLYLSTNLTDKEKTNGYIEPGDGFKYPLIPATKMVGYCKEHPTYRLYKTVVEAIDEKELKEELKNNIKIIEVKK